MKVAGLLPVVALMAPSWVTASLLAPAPPETTTRSDTVQVAPPTGETETDRASILAALERVQPGGTVQFAPGTYVVGEYIQVSIPRLNILGHPTGTTLRGCDPADYEGMEREFADFIAAGGVGGGTSLPDVGRCGILELRGGQQTVRGLTFEHSYWGLILGCCHDESGYRVTDGGHLVEGNTFRFSKNGIRAGSDWPEPSLIRGNKFIDVHSPIGVLGRTFHVLDNEISVRMPDQVIFGHPGVAIAFGAEPFATSCERNVVAGNRIEGHPDGILLYVRPPGRCRDNIIRDNTIRVRRVWLPASSRGFWVDFSSEDDRSVVGVPLSLQVESGEGGTLADNLIEGNRIIRGEGIAIEVLRAARTRIENNTITGVTVRNPFPGNTLWGGQERWRDANGSGIWVSPESEDNEIVGNTFEDVAGAEVFLEGDRNRVTLQSTADSVLDLGTGNRVTVPDPASETLESRFGPTRLDPWPSDVPRGDTVRYTGIVGGISGGERLMWQDGPDAWAYSYDMGRSGFPRTERLELDADALPVRLEVSGQKAPWDLWEERFERQGPVARWTTPVDEGEQPVEGPRFYAALQPAHDPGVLARALLRRPSGRLPLLPEGEARLEALGERTVERDGRTRTVRHYAVHGLDLKPAYVWLDEDGATLADEWMIREGWESVFSRLKDASRAALADHVRALADLILVDGDPTTDISDIRRVTTVIKDGRVYDPAAIYRALGIEPCCQE